MFAFLEQYQTNARQFRETDVFLVSYPRSGNTWMRLLLSDLILQSQGLHPKTGINLIPDVYKTDIESWDQNSLTRSCVRIIKTHEPCSPLYHRVIYLFRQPVDCLHSFYHYRSALNRAKSKPALFPEAFYHTQIPQWVDHVQSYLQSAKRCQAEQGTYSRQIQFISYEDLHSKPESVLQKVAQFIQLPIEPAQIRQAIEHQSFRNVRERAVNRPEELGFLEEVQMDDFFRQGSVGTAQQELSDAVVQQIQAAALPTYQEAQRLCL